MASSAPLSRPIYVGTCTVKRLIKAAKTAGLDVGGFEALPDGTVRILEARAVPKPEDNLFDQLSAAGKI